jgi:hypothetical protein
MISRAVRYAIFLVLLALPVQAATPEQWLAARVAAAGAEPQPVFITSYDVIHGKSEFDLANATTAFTYDQAMAIMALLAAGDVPSARRLGDALVYAQGHDRFYHDGRLRNAYLAGPTGEGMVKLPGYWNVQAGEWYEDPYQDGAATGNNAWAGVALLRLFDASGDQKYAAAARGIGTYLLTLKDGHDGLPGGYERYDDAPETLTWRSAEHNTAVLAMMRLLEDSYPGQGFGAEAESAQRFLISLWAGDHFLVGTTPDGVTPNTAYSGYDVQILTLLALPDRTPYLAALTYAERVHGVPGGFDYSSAKKGIWAEGTMEAATLYAVLGNATRAQGLLAGRLADNKDGGLYAVAGIEGAPLDSLSTGLALGNSPPKGEDSMLHYYRRVAVAPTAWAVLAEKAYNPLRP